MAASAAAAKARPRALSASARAVLSPEDDARDWSVTSEPDALWLDLCAEATGRESQAGAAGDPTGGERLTDSDDANSLPSPARCPAREPNCVDDGAMEEELWSRSLRKVSCRAVSRDDPFDVDLDVVSVANVSPRLCPGPTPCADFLRLERRCLAPADAPASELDPLCPSRPLLALPALPEPLAGPLVSNESHDGKCSPVPDRNESVIAVGAWLVAAFKLRGRGGGVGGTTGFLPFAAAAPLHAPATAAPQRLGAGCAACGIGRATTGVTWRGWRCRKATLSPRALATFTAQAKDVQMRGVPGEGDKMASAVWLIPLPQQARVLAW